MSARTAPSPEDVAEIVALDSQPVLRNLRITQGYSDLSAALHHRIGGPDINWTTLGAWASKTAGEFIRDDEVPKPIEALLGPDGPFAGIERRLGLADFAGLLHGVVSDVSANIMVGNRVVFAEIAGCVAAYLQELANDETADPAKLEAFVGRLEPGDPEPDVATWQDDKLVAEQRGGQGMLRDMCRTYYAAQFEKDRKKRAELMLLGNGYGGLHEQTRLQTYIAGSLNAPIEDLLMGRVHEQLSSDTSHALADGLLRPLISKIEDLWHDFATEEMMELTLPDGVLHLSRPIPPEPGGPLVPPALETIHNHTLRSVLSKYDALEIALDQCVLEKAASRVPALGAVAEGVSHLRAIAVGAVDWVNFDQRMRYILMLFRMRAQDPHLFEPPFSTVQRAEIDAGRIPEGPL